MARTKQTARKCLVATKAPRKQLVAMKCARKSALAQRGRGGRRGNNLVHDDSDSESQKNVVNNQQFSVKFDDQAKVEQQCVTGQIISCSNCQAIFTSQSKKYNKEEYLKMKNDKKLPDEKKQKFSNNCQSAWICQFCLTHNTLPKNYNAPSIENPCFLIQKANKKKKGNKNQQDDEQNKVLIFCIDISGSMGLTVFNTKSRLDTVKQAIIDEINRMNFQNQVIKVGLITFGSYVTLVGDGKSFKKKNLDSEIYNDFDKIVDECNKIKKFSEPLKKSYQPLKKSIQNIGLYGSTALGPGLLASIELASKGGGGSKVILCTDGQANVGIGGVFNIQNNSAFYQKAADFAKRKRVSVSILSLKGDKCNLKQLGKLSLASGGSVLKIDPRALGTQFSKITKEEILGTSSQLVIKVNKIFQIVSHIPNELSADKSTLTQQFGNFSADTQLTFEFKVLTKQEASKRPQIDMDLFNQQKVPMQIQLSYIGGEGNRYKQIITDWRQLTENQKEIYEGANFGLFAASVLQRASLKIRNSEFKEAENLIKGYWSLVEQKFSKEQKKQDLDKFGTRVKKLQKILNSKQRKKQPLNKNRGRSRSRDNKNRGRSRSRDNKNRGRSRSRDNKNRGSSRSRDNKNRGRSRSIDNKQKKSRKLSSQSGGMSSDEQEQILFKQMRARSRSNSPKRNSKSKPNKK